MKISTKLYGAVGTLALTGILVAGAGAVYLRMLGTELTDATERTATKLDLVNAARARSWESVAALRGVFLFASLNSRSELDASVRRWETAYRRIGEQIAQIRPLLTTEDGRKELARFEAGWSDYGRTSADYMRLAQERKFDQLTALVPKVQSFAGLAEETLDFLKTQQRNLLKDAQARTASLRTQSTVVTVALSATLLAIALVAAFVVMRIDRALAMVIAELSEGAEQVATSATQVATASQSLAQGSSEQAASLQQTSASTEQINAMARRNSENARSAAAVVALSQEKSAGTSQSLAQMVTAMGEIDAHSARISRIIKTIDEIAFQTNILALNAAVEAARAGEAGMGFAVVADEVRNLAQRSAGAARETASLIEESVTRSANGKSSVDHVVKAMHEMAEEGGKVKALVDQVERGSQEQARGTEQIGQAIAQMEHITQAGAASAQESASAAAELNAQSDALRDVAQRLSAMVDGERG